MSEKGKKGNQKGGGGKGGKAPEEVVAKAEPVAEPKEEKKADKKPVSEQVEADASAAVAKAPAPKKDSTANNSSASPVTSEQKVDSTNKKEKKDPKAARVHENGRGVVKAVLSGDTIVVINLSKQQGPPTEKIISLSNLNAPQLGRRKQEDKDALPDKPWAWQSREFLRQKLIGKQVTYVIESKTPKKDYGVVFLQEENVAKDIVANGWARVRRPPPGAKDINPEVENIINLEEAASNAGKGIYNKNEEAAKASIRNVVEVSNPTDFFPRLKGSPQTGVVEQVRAGNSLRIILTPSFYEINLILSGVDSPSARTDRMEPFGREAKFFTEHHLLNREVTIILEGADKHNFYGTVQFSVKNVAEELLREGLGKYVEWSGARTAFSERLKEAENQAKERKLRIWKDYVSPKPLSRQEEKKIAKPGKEITGRVIEVANAGCIVILDPSNTEHRIYLSSVKVPRASPTFNNPKEESSKDPKKEREEALERSFAWEAKEYLRKKIIGTKVRCVLDYTREVPKTNNKTGKETVEERNFCSVYLDKNNVAVELVEQGLANSQEHRGGEQRSRDYEHIIFAETRAKKAGKGMHAPSDKQTPVHIADITTDVKIAKQKFPFLQRYGRMKGVVEYEMSASRFKILVPKESCQIILSLTAIQTPQRDSAYFQPALTFAREKVHQHDVEFDVVAQDTRGPGFVGNIWLGKQSLACILLEQGFAKIYRPTDRDSEMIIAEDIAKRAKKNLWHDYDEAKEEAKRKERQEERQERMKPKQEYVDVVVTEIVDGSKFFVQLVGPDVEKLEELMKQLNTDEGESYSPHYDEIVKAQFTADDAWYRAKVVKTLPGNEFKVFYIDYGNSETVPSSRIRKLSEEFKKLPSQAVEAVLAYLKTPPIEEDYGKEAAEFLRDLVWGKTMMANVEKREGSTLYLSLGDRESQVHVNAALLRAGLARVERVRGEQYREMLEKLKEEESKARSTHSGVWEYGDPGSDEEDEDKRKGPKRRN